METITRRRKRRYLKKSHRCQLAYKYKKMLYIKQVKKIIPKKPGGPYAQFIKEKKGQKPPEGQSFLKYWGSVYEKLTPEQKAKYEEKAQKEKELYEKKLEQFKDKVFDMPKKPRTAFSFYLSDRLQELKKDNPDSLFNILIKKAAEEWQNLTEAKKDEYIKNSEKDKIRFKKQFQEFKKMGYYSKHVDEIVLDIDYDRKKSSKKSSSKQGSKKSKKIRNSSKKKTKEEKSKSQSKKKSQKKLQKSKSKSKSKKKEKKE